MRRRDRQREEKADALSGSLGFGPDLATCYSAMFKANRVSKIAHILDRV
jgi:hypothetical protein